MKLLNRAIKYLKQGEFDLSLICYKNYVYNLKHEMDSESYEWGRIIQNYANGDCITANQMFIQGNYNEAFDLYKRLYYQGCDPLIQDRIKISKENLLFPESNRGKMGYVDTTGNWVIEAQYEEAHEFIYGLAAVEINNGRYGMINRKNNMLIIPIWDFIAPRFYNGLIVVNKGEKYGFFSDSYELKIPLLFTTARNFHNSFASVELNRHWTLIDTTGEIIFPPIYEDIGILQEDLVAVKLGGKYGYMNKEHKLVIGFTYEEASSFSDGLSAVKFDGKWGYIDNKGKFIIPCKYEKVWDFSMGMALVSLDKEWFFINKRNEYIFNGNFLRDELQLDLLC